MSPETLKEPINSVRTAGLKVKVLRKSTGDIGYTLDQV